MGEERRGPRACGLAKPQGRGDIHCPMRQDTHPRCDYAARHSPSLPAFRHTRKCQRAHFQNPQSHTQTHLLLTTRMVRIRLRVTSVAATSPPLGCCSTTAGAVEWLCELAWAVELLTSRPLSKASLLPASFPGPKGSTSSSLPHKTTEGLPKYIPSHIKLRKEGSREGIVVPFYRWES